MTTAKFLDIIKSFSGYLRVDNKAGYKDTYTFDDLGINDFVTKQVLADFIPVGITPIVYNLPAGTETPIIINFADDTIKLGSASVVDIGFSLSNYRANPDIKFKLVIDDENSRPIGNEGWILNEEWDGEASYQTLVELTLQPDTDTGIEGGLTLDNLNIIIKP